MEVRNRAFHQHSVEGMTVEYRSNDGGRGRSGMRTPRAATLAEQGTAIPPRTVHQCLGLMRARCRPHPCHTAAPAGVGPRDRGTEGGRHRALVSALYRPERNYIEHVLYRIQHEEMPIRTCDTARWLIQDIHVGFRRIGQNFVSSCNSVPCAWAMLQFVDP